MCRVHRFSGIVTFPSSFVFWRLLVAFLGNPIWICWGRPQWLRHPGHTLIPADLRPFFILRFHESWKPCPARCLETRLLPASHPAVASGDRIGSLGLELDLECFRTPVEKNRKLAVEIELLHLSRHPHKLCPYNAKTPRRDLTDVGSLLHDLTKPG